MRPLLLQSVTESARNVVQPLGIIIPTYSFVSCSPDIQRVVMEIKHGPRGQGKLGLFTVLSRHLLFNPPPL